MRPLRIFLSNFMGHRLTDIDCTQFQSVLIVAANRNDSRESNGLGKTTIFRAIEYALFGKAPANLDKIVRDGCDKCEVIFEFEVNGGVYRVTRTRNKKTSKSEVFLAQKINDKWEDVSQKTPSQTEAELAKLIKITHVAFCHSVFFAQADLEGLSSGSASDRKAILKEALQLAIYTKYEKVAKEKVSVLQKELEKLRNSLSFIGNPEKDIETTSEWIENRTKTLTIAEEQFGKLQLELQEKRMAYAELEKKLASSDVNALSNEFLVVTNQKTSFQKLISTISNTISFRENDHSKQSLELTNLTRQLEDSQKEQQALLEQIVRAPSDVTADIEKMREKEMEGRTYISKVGDEVKALSQPMAQEDNCQRCKQPVAQSHRDICETQRLVDLKGKTENLEKAKKVLTAIQVKRSAYDNELLQVNKRTQTLSNLENKLTLVKSKISGVETLLAQTKESITSQQRELKTLVEQRDSYVEKETKLKADIAAADQKLLEFQLSEAKSAMDVMTKNGDLLYKEITNLNVEMGSLQGRLALVQGYLADKTSLSIQLKERGKEYSIRLKVAQAVGPNGIPSLIISTILDDLQIVTNSSLANMRAGLEVRFSLIKTRGDGQQEDSLEIAFFINGKDRDYELISGGQKMMFAWAFKFALSVIIQHRIGVDIKFLQFDEVDAMLDDAAKASYADIIKKWQDKFTIFAVTHNNALKDRFSHAILVESDGENGTCGRLVSSW